MAKDIKDLLTIKVLYYTSLLYKTHATDLLSFSGMMNAYQDICCLEDIFKDINTLNHSLQGRAAILIISISVMSEKITGS